MQIINKDNVQEGNNEANGFIISGGIVVILRSAVIPDGTIVWELRVKLIFSNLILHSKKKKRTMA